MPMSETLLPPLPKYQLGKVEKLRDHICEVIAYPYFNERCEGPVLYDLCADLSRVFSKKISQEVLFSSVAAHLLGKELTQPLLLRTAWRLAGNLPSLLAGRVVGPWTSTPPGEWMPIQIVSGGLVREFDKLGFEFSFRVLAGSYCSHSLTAFWSTKMCRFIARHIGYTYKQRYRDMSQLVGLRLYGLSIPLKGKSGKPSFKSIDVSSSMLTYNKAILRRRFRVEPCPFRYNHQCHRCAVGYVGNDKSDSCKAATHPLAYEVGICPVCTLQDAIFDPFLSKAMCLQCLTKQRCKPKAR